MISAVINSLNEGSKLDKCLRSVEGFVDEIIVINMESTDDTVEVAKKYKTKIYFHKKVDYIEPVRRFAVDKAAGDWILLLDPDEIVPQPLKKVLIDIVRSDEAEAVKIPRLNIIFNKKIKHTNFWPDYQIRFFKKDKIIFYDQIHSYPKIIGKIKVLEASEYNALLHYPYQKPKEYLERMNRYTTIEAKNRLSNGKIFSLFRLISQPPLEFIKRYIYHLGFLDGCTGLLLSIFQAYYYIQVEYKLLKHK